MHGGPAHFSSPTEIRGDPMQTRKSMRLSGTLFLLAGVAFMYAVASFA